MSKVCDICGKESMWGHNISHSHRLTNRRWLPNLQKIKVKVGDGYQKMRVCASCIRSGKIEKAP